MMKLLRLVLIGMFAVALVAFPVVAGDGYRCEDQGCNSAGTKLNPSTPRGGWSIPTKTIVNALLKAYNLARNTSYRIHPLVGLLIPSIGIERSGPIVGTVDVIECEDCCGEAQRLMVVPVVESRGRVIRTSGPLVLPPWETTTAARGKEILDSESGTETDTKDQNSNRGTVIRENYDIASGNTSFTLSFLAGLAEITAYTSPRADDLTALSDDELEKMAPVQVNDTELEGLTAYCGCVDRDATEEEIEEVVPDLVNTAPLPSFMPTIEISLDGTTQVPGAFSAGDPDGDPVWVYLDLGTRFQQGMRVAIDQETGHATFWFEGLSPEDAEILATNRTPREVVYLYDLKPGVEPARGEKPEEGQYFHKVDTKRVNLIFTRSQPPIARDVEETMTTAQFREAGCVVSARFEAIDDDADGHPISFKIDYSRTSSELQWTTGDLYPVCGEDGICRAYGMFQSTIHSRSDDEVSLPLGSYQVGFLVHEHGENGSSIFVNEGTYTLEIVSTPPAAVDDAFSLDPLTYNTALDLERNGTIDEKSDPNAYPIICRVLDNDTDLDGDPIKKLQVVAEKGPQHGTVKVTADPSGSGQPLFVYTSEPGFFGEDSFAYQASDNGADWSNEATVTVTVRTPPTAHPAEVSTQCNMEASSWYADVDSLILSVTDPDVGSDASKYSFSFSSSSNDVCITSLCGSSIIANRECRPLGAACSCNGSLVTLTCPVTFSGQAPSSPDSPVIAVFDYSVTDPDGFESRSTLTATIDVNQSPYVASTGDDGRAGRVRLGGFATVATRDIPYFSNDALIHVLEYDWTEVGCLTFIDPDGDALTFSLHNEGARPARVDYNVVSGSPGVYPITLMYYIDRQRALSDHRGESDYVDSFTVTATDPFGAYAKALVEVTVDMLNSDPVCVDDEVTTPMNTAIEFDVLLNDSDVDGDELSVVVVGSAGNGVASSVSDNTIRYVPDNGFYGDDTFT
ncbi:MAG: hypothetical protein E4H08_09155, partial [Candidatus Atribacteria bacterium]